MVLCVCRVFLMYRHWMGIGTPSRMQISSRIAIFPPRQKFDILMQIYLISYGVWRIIIEIFRADERGAIILGLAPSQWQSILFIVGGIALLVIYYVKKWQFILPPKESIVKESIEKKEDVDTSNE